jgi:hypothetical protein
MPLALAFARALSMAKLQCAYGAPGAAPSGGGACNCALAAGRAQRSRAPAARRLDTPRGAGAGLRGALELLASAHNSNQLARAQADELECDRACTVAHVKGGVNRRRSTDRLASDTMTKRVEWKCQNLQSCDYTWYAGTGFILWRVLGSRVPRLGE